MIFGHYILNHVSIKLPNCRSYSGYIKSALVRFVETTKVKTSPVNETIKWFNVSVTPEEKDALQHVLTSYIAACDSASAGSQWILNLSNYIDHKDINSEVWLELSKELDISVALYLSLNHVQVETNQDSDSYFVLQNDGALLGLPASEGESADSYRHRLTQYIQFLNRGGDVSKFGEECKFFW